MLHLTARLGWAAALGLAGSPPPLVAQSDSVEVSRLSFEGNRSFGDAALREAIVTEDTHCRTFLLAPFCWVDSEWAIERRLLDEAEVGRDRARIRLFYFRRGFREATVDAVTSEGTDGSVSVTFLVDEGRPVLVDQVEVAAWDSTSLGNLPDDMPIRPGEPLSLLTLEAGREELLGTLRDAGFAHAEVLAGFFIPASAPYTARVRFDPLPGPLTTIGTIRVSGSRSLSEDAVRDVLTVREGDVFSERQLDVAQRNVFELDIVRHAEIHPDLDHSPDSVVPLEVRVNEAPVHRVRAGGGMSTFECLVAEGRWTDRNYFGGGRRLEATARVWNVLADDFESLCTQAGRGIYGRINFRLGLDFLQPVVFGPRNALSTRLFVERESFPNLFVRQTVGTNLTLSRNVGRLSATGISYQPEYGSYDAADAYFCSNFLICSPEEIELASAASMLAPVGVSVSLDRTHPLTDPVRGWAGFVTFETAGTLTFSDYAYDRLILEGSAFKELGRGSQRVLGGRLRVGFLNPKAFGGLTTDASDIELSAPQKRFYSGGASTVRGFAAGRLGPRNLQTDVRNLVPAPDRPSDAPCVAEQILDLSCDANPLSDSRFTEAPSGGNVVVVGNVELRAWLSEKLQAGIFLDFGQVWPDDSDVDLATIEFTPGFGIRYPTPIGPVRLDLAYNFRRTEELPAITSQLEPQRPGDSREVVTVGLDGTRYVVSDGLAPLEPPVRFGSDDMWSLSRFQLHFSIGQAF